MEELEVAAYKSAVASAVRDWNQIMLLSIAEQKDPMQVKYDLIRKYLNMPIVENK